MSTNQSRLCIPTFGGGVDVHGQPRVVGAQAQKSGSNRKRCMQSQVQSLKPGGALSTLSKLGSSFAPPPLPPLTALLSSMAVHGGSAYRPHITGYADTVFRSVGVRVESQFETNGLEAMYIQPVETKRFQHGVKLMLLSLHLPTAALRSSRPRCRGAGWQLKAKR